MHLAHTKLALNAGKHVVCEKPLAVNEAQARELVDLARAKGLFLMEAMWTRFFPAVRKVQEILKSGELGPPRCLQADFGFVGPTDKSHRLLDPAQAGGAMLDIGIYLVQAATMMFGTSEPDLMSCTGQITPEGVDSEGALSLTWKDKGSASLMFTLHAHTPENAVFTCERGNIRLYGPAHCPTRMTVSKVDGARGKFREEDIDFPLPKLPAGQEVNYPHSEGMLYEVQAAEQCLAEGMLECPDYRLDESLAVMRLMDSYRRQMGVVYPFEKSE
eukprot:gb/GFBE01083457.1/.p1 GENE.gb/GFBE01083457.1/~~gb/GFBE01083457.1/.p1  ORF type:complete len:273 (+),score=55.91 gb/GFBE01083457.1/:1-819(+)